MRMLFIAGGSAATVFAQAPLATAARNAGHEVFMAAGDDMAPVITGTGLPAVAVSSSPISRFIYADRQGVPVQMPANPGEHPSFTGGWFARMAADWLRPLRELAGSWRPDLVVGGVLSYAAPLLAAELGVPYVRQAWDALGYAGADDGANLELTPELAELGLERLPEPDLHLEVAPPSLLLPQPSPARRTEQLRWISVNTQRRLDAWMYTRPARPRVCVTAGSRVARTDDSQDYRQRLYDLLRITAAQVTTLDAEVVVAAPDKIADDLRAELPGVQVGWLPLDVVGPRCDLLVHTGGGVTSMTALSVGLPQVIIPEWPIGAVAASRIAGYGAGVVVPLEQATADSVTDACREVLADASYAHQASAIAREIASLPTPAETIETVESLDTADRVAAR